MSNLGNFVYKEGGMNGGGNGTGRFRLPLPVLGPEPHADGLQGRDPSHNFLLFRHPPPKPQYSVQQTSEQDVLEPQGRDLGCDLFQPNSPFHYTPPQRQQMHQRLSNPGTFNTQGSNLMQSTNLTSQPSFFKPHAPNQLDTLFSLQNPGPSQQQPAQHQPIRSASVFGDRFSSPAAQAALRQQRNNKQFGQTMSKTVPVSLLSSPNVPVTHGASPSFLQSPHLAAPNISSTKRLALPHAPPFANGIQLINPKERIPPQFQPVFPYQVFNAVQSKCFESVYMTNDNVVVSAPTGSGKTALLEMAICRLLTQKGNDNAKIVYISPTKALCKEKAEQWRKKFAMMSMIVSELTGDTSRAEMRTIREAKVIVTTPEKWDSITRSWSDHEKLLDLVELFLIDEVHILKESRGATLEAVVSRMKTYGAKVRFIALSATVPNSSDIATWLGRDHENPSLPASREVFGEEFRPVKLQKVVHGMEGKLADHPFDKYLNSQLWKYIEMHTQKKPMLVFCMTRKSCQDAAEELAKQWSQRQPHARLWPEPMKRIPVIDASLQELVRYGVAFHHAGLEADDRKAVHQAFEDGHLSVICCTSTLAVGINLPCHTVVLKGTVCYQDGGQIGEYSDLEVMQMLGRAGRPQYEDSALAIILTRAQNKKRYEQLESGKQILESTLHKNLIEHVNSEISLGTFQDTHGAKLWLGGTFLSVRLNQNPHHYKALTDGKSTARTQPVGSIENQLEQICEAAINNLRDTSLIQGDATFQHTEYGRAMSKYMIQFETMKMILDIPRGAKTKDLLNTLCKASEFKEIRWQASEREIFRDINKDPFILYPVEGSIATIPQKVSLLIQMELGRVEVASINGFERQRLRGEARRVLDAMHRLIRAVIECKASDADGSACWTALELARSLTAKAWEGRPMQLLQVPQLGPVLMRKLVSRDIRTVHQLMDYDPVDIERIASRNPPFGKKLKDSISFFPRLTLVVAVKDSKVGTDGKPVVHVDALLGFLNARGKWLTKIPTVTFLAVTSEGVSAYFCRESLNTFKPETRNVHQIHFAWTPSVVNETLICRFACEEIVGTVVSSQIEHSLPASAFPRPVKKETQQSPTVLQKTSPSQVSAGMSPLKDEIDDDEMLGIWDAIPPQSGSVEHNEIDSDVDEEDLLAMADGGGNFEQGPLGPTDRSQKNKIKALDDGAHLMVGRSTPSYLSPYQKTGPNIKQPQPRKSYENNGSDQIVEDEAVEEKPILLPNGRFKCGHPCSQSGGGTTARGDMCGHDCCRNGSKNPPKKAGKTGKRKEQAREPEDSKSDAVPDFSCSEPPTKRARAKDTSKSKIKPSASSSMPAPTESRFPSIQPDLDLSLYGIDEEGLIDLTEDYEPVHSSGRHGAGTKLGAGSHVMRQAHDGSKRTLSSDSILDDFTDDDFVDIDTLVEQTREKKRESRPHERRNTVAYSAELSPATSRIDAQGKTSGKNVKIHPSTTNRESIGVPEYEHMGGGPGMRGPTEALHMSAIVAKSPPHTTSNERISAEMRRDTGKSSLRRWSKPLLSSAAVTDAEPSEQSAVGELKATKEEDYAEPEWVNDFDPDFISEFRGMVDFI